jgi:hypothetical protein
MFALADVRAHLRMTSTYTADDSMLQNIFIPAAQDAIEGECDYVMPKVFEDWYDGGSTQVFLRNQPLLTVDLVEEIWFSSTKFELDFQPQGSTATSAFAYSIEPGAVLTRRSAGNMPVPFVAGVGNIHVVYTVGRESVPSGLYLAGLELIAHWYQGRMQRQAERTSADSYDSTSVIDMSRRDSEVGIDFAIPTSILLMLKKHRRAPIIG